MKSSLAQKNRRDNAHPGKQVASRTMDSHASTETGKRSQVRSDSLRQLADDRLKHFALFR